MLNSDSDPCNRVDRSPTDPPPAPSVGRTHRRSSKILPENIRGVNSQSHDKTTKLAKSHLALVPLEVAVLAAHGLGHAVGEVAPRPGALARHGLPVLLVEGRGVILDTLSLVVRTETNNFQHSRNYRAFNSRINLGKISQNPISSA